MTDNNKDKLEEQPVPQNTANKRKATGKLIKFRTIGIIACIILAIFLYNLLKTPTSKPKKQVEAKEENVENQKNPFATKRSESIDETAPPIKDVPQKNNTPIQNNPIQNSNTTQQQNTQLLQYRIEQIKKMRENEEKAKNSPISFRATSVVSNNNSPSQPEVQVAEKDYDGNRQASKKNFLHNEKSPNFYLNSVLVSPISAYEIKAGDFIPAIMLNAIDSDLPAKVIVAIVRENVYDTISGNYLLIPQGTRVVGTYDSNVTFGQNRLLVIWQRLIMPDGSSLNLDNMQGVDMSGRVGVTGKVNNHFATLLKGVILSSIAGAAGGIATDDKNNWQNNAANGAGEQIVRIGDRFAEKALSRQPTIDVKVGERFNIMVHSDIILKPYK